MDYHRLQQTIIIEVDPTNKQRPQVREVLPVRDDAYSRFLLLLAWSCDFLPLKVNVVIRIIYYNLYSRAPELASMR